MLGYWGLSFARNLYTNAKTRTARLKLQNISRHTHMPVNKNSVKLEHLYGTSYRSCVINKVFYLLKKSLQNLSPLIVPSAYSPTFSVSQGVGL